MAEKGGGGFGFTPSTAKKSSFKQPVAKSAVGGSSKKHKTVQFDTSSESEGSPVANNNNGSFKSNGKGLFDSSASKGDTDKGGKGGKTGKGWGKSSAPKLPVVVQLEIEKDLPKNAKCMMDCAAEAALQGIQDQLSILSRDPTIKLPLAFNKALEYAKGSGRYSNPLAVWHALEKLRVLKITESELCLISNVCPDTVDEVYALIPSLKTNRLTTEGAIKNLLYELDNLKS
ncbi:DNA-directed RNA polymerases IV and V subunit 4-like [Papaver somniferum]|uniref:DNA-directed RNA polymerases IV and V subunit 4-like n=1 Tax=Papaver somniferum TaxID=3469 RepID=UPI000E6F6455|nr:DNA-directed RNA polymerases IV and V subunit 4-like [Papaver somniferum]XP_026447977.1 DNA-directed RNA polymerases IV and V subunit 4-like [Papaver somniferum]